MSLALVAAKSAPAQNESPAPVRMTTRVSSSADCLIASRSNCTVSRSTELRRSGRLMVMRLMPSSIETSSFCAWSVIDVAPVRTACGSGRVSSCASTRPLPQAVLTFHPCSLVIAHQPFRNAARFLAALALDRDAPRRLHATLYRFDRGQPEAAANECSGRHRRNETHAIQPIVNAHSHATHRHRPLAQFAQQRESQKAVRDCFFERRFARGAIRIHVNPLPVFGTFGKLVDALLRYLEPIADGDLSSDEVAEFSNAFDLCDRHSEVSSNSEDSRRSSRLLARRQRTSLPCRNATCAGASRPATAR